MPALHRIPDVIREYQSDSSSKRPLGVFRHRKRLFFARGLLPPPDQTPLDGGAFHISSAAPRRPGGDTKHGGSRRGARTCLSRRTPGFPRARPHPPALGF